MAKQARRATSRNGGASDFIWNFIGGAMISAMLAGVIYVLVGMFSATVNNDPSYWELIHLKRYFIAVLVVYVVMPTVLANTIGFIFGSKSGASGSKPRM